MHILHKCRRSRQFSPIYLTSRSSSSSSRWRLREVPLWQAQGTNRPQVGKALLPSVVSASVKKDHQGYRSRQVFSRCPMYYSKKANREPRGGEVCCCGKRGSDLTLWCDAEKTSMGVRSGQPGRRPGMQVACRGQCTHNHRHLRKALRDEYNARLSLYLEEEPW